MDSTVIIIILVPILFLIIMSYLASGYWTFKPSTLISTNSYSGLTTSRGGGSKANIIISLSSIILIVIAIIFLLFTTGGGGGIAKLA